MAFICFIGNGGVGTYRRLLVCGTFVLGDHRRLAALVSLSTNRKEQVVLTCDWQARGHVFVWQRELEFLGVVVVFLDIDELEGDEALVTSSECFGTWIVGLGVHITPIAKVGVSKGAGC